MVICTAYSDHSWTEIAARLEMSDRLLILRKPFDSIEVQQIAASLTKNGRPVPIIALSGYAVSGYQAACLAGGMDGFLSKPVGLKQIQEALRQWLSARDAHAA